MKTHSFWMIGLSLAVLGFVGLPAQTHASVSAASALGEANTTVLAQTFQVLQGTLDELQERLRGGAPGVPDPAMASKALSAIRGNLLEMSGTIAALDARAAHIASEKAPRVAIAPASSPTITATGMSYDGIPTAMSEPTASKASPETASVINIGKRVWPIALIILALTIPFLFRKQDKESLVTIKTVKAPVLPATARNT